MTAPRILAGVRVLAPAAALAACGLVSCSRKDARRIEVTVLDKSSCRYRSQRMAFNELRRAFMKARDRNPAFDSGKSIVVRLPRGMAKEDADRVRKALARRIVEFGESIAFERAAFPLLPVLRWLAALALVGGGVAAFLSYVRRKAGAAEAEE